MRRTPDPQNYRQGHPSLEEWSGPWSRLAFDCYPDEAECDRIYALFCDFISTNGLKDSAYFRGDHYCDRSEYLEFCDPEALTVDLILELQSFLGNVAQRWRVIIPLYGDDADSIVIYPEVVRWPVKLDGDMAASVSIAREMIRRRRRFEEARAARFGRENKGQ